MRGLGESRTHCTTSSMLNTLSGIRAIGGEGEGQKSGGETRKSETCT